ncbi:hypothetical protein ACN20G_23520 [Streptomyces sp. BI20]|uniref:hypothetical protein n=1 Tax=Streptomyces sp. BI20 TaxID=3403460 RepID=UPI003C7329DA
MSRVKTGASSIVTMSAYGLGLLTCVTIGDNAGLMEVVVIRELEDRMETTIQEATVVYAEQINNPHPGLPGSRSFFQFEIFKEDK